MKQLHVSADCETLSLNENPTLISIGAVAFDPEGNDTVQSLRNGAVFNVIIDIRDQAERFGRHLDAETIKWWMKQSNDAREWASQELPEYFTTALSYFSAFVLNTVGKDSYLWTNGAAEDAVWLRSAFRAASLTFPFHYRKVRDTRSIFDFIDTPELVEPGLVGHVAVDDAIYQALRIQHAYRQRNELISAYQQLKQTQLKEAA